MFTIPLIVAVIIGLVLGQVPAVVVWLKVKLAKAAPTIASIEAQAQADILKITAVAAQAKAAVVAKAVVVPKA
jgi:hypothetical protein